LAPPRDYASVTADIGAPRLQCKECTRMASPIGNERFALDAIEAP
jgi:hypothetical protein